MLRGSLVVTCPQQVEGLKQLCVEEQPSPLLLLVGGECFPEAGGARDGGLNGGVVLPAEEVDVEAGGGEEELELGAPELRGGGGAGGQRGERGGGVPIYGERGGELRLEVAGPEKGRATGEEVRRGWGREEPQPEGVGEESWRRSPRRLSCAMRPVSASTRRRPS